MAGKSSFMEKNEFQVEKIEFQVFLAKSSFPRNAQKISLPDFGVHKNVDTVNCNIANRKIALLTKLVSSQSPNPAFHLVWSEYQPPIDEAVCFG